MVFHHFTIFLGNAQHKDNPLWNNLVDKYSNSGFTFVLRKDIIIISGMSKRSGTRYTDFISCVKEVTCAPDLDCMMMLRTVDNSTDEEQLKVFYKSKLAVSNDYPFFIISE